MKQCIQFALVLCLCFFARAEDPPAPHVVEQEPFVIERSMEGLLLPEPGGEVAISVDSWTDLVVLDFVAHGTEVKKGDVLIRLDLRSIQQRIRDAELELAQHETGLKRAELELAQLEKTQAISLDQAKRNLAQAREDVRVYRAMDLPNEKRKTATKKQDSGNNLAYQEEELRQLKRMYEEDQITEETEEIILRRQKDTVARQASILKEWEVFEKRQNTIDFPRKEQKLGRTEEEKVFELEKIESLQPLDLAVKKTGVEQLRQTVKKSKDGLVRLRKDAEAMMVKAPRDGVVYHGRFFKADWLAADAEKYLQPGARPLKNLVLMTVVDPVARRAQVWLKEADAWMAPLLKEGVLSPKTDPALKLPARVSGVSAFPRMKGWYEVFLEIDPPGTRGVTPPGAGCSFRAKPYRQEQAIMVPGDRVFSDDAKPGARYVMVLDQADNPVRRDVETGYEDGGKVEILNGLEAGERIVTRDWPARADARVGQGKPKQDTE